MSKITIYTLAKELNMTPSMISRAFSPNGKISEEKREIILETAKKYGFTPNKFASRLSMKNVRIGILINSRFDVNTDKMIVGIENAYEKLKDYKNINMKFQMQLHQKLLLEQNIALECILIPFL